MKKTKQKKANREMAPRKPIAFDGMQLTWDPFTTPQRYTGVHPLGAVIVRPCSIPEGIISDGKGGIRPGYRHDGWGCFLNNALLGRALRPGEAAKRGEKWLREIRTEIENGVAREMQPKVDELAKEIAKNSREIRQMLRDEHVPQPTDLLTVHRETSRRVEAPTLTVNDVRELTKALRKGDDRDAAGVLRPERLLTIGQAMVLQAARSLPPSPAGTVLRMASSDLLTCLLLMTVVGSVRPLLVTQATSMHDAIMVQVNELRATWRVPPYFTMLSTRQHQKKGAAAHDVIITYEPAAS